jgi:hypothetical protein
MGSKQKVQQVGWITKSLPYGANFKEDHAETTDDTIQKESGEIL